jgi:hypothetical protein
MKSTNYRQLNAVISQAVDLNAENVVIIPKEMTTEANKCFAAGNRFFIWTDDKKPTVEKPYGFPTIITYHINYSVSTALDPLVFSIETQANVKNEEGVISFWTSTTQGPEILTSSGNRQVLFFVPDAHLSGTTTLRVSLVACEKTSVNGKDQYIVKKDKDGNVIRISNMIHVPVTIPKE